MPGMLFYQHLAAAERGTPNLQEEALSCKTDHSLDFLDVNPLRYGAAVHAPLVPSRYKACRLSQAQVEWILKAKEESQPKLLSINSRRKGVSTGSNQDSMESDNDLADMVHDFMENGSCGQEFHEGSDSDPTTSLIPKSCDGLQMLTTTMSSTEREMLNTATIFILGANEVDLSCPSDSTHCRGGCIRRLVVKHLRMSGYNAALCRSKWHNTGKVPGGEYEYVDVSLDGERAQKERLIIDLDFRSQFEIARPSQHYQAALRSLPLIFVGKPGKLEQVLQIMSEAAKCSLKQNSMHLPPWRTLEYMRAKWLSYYERNAADMRNQGQMRLQSLNKCSISGFPEFIHCREQHKRLKAALRMDVERGLILKSITNEGRRGNATRARRGAR